MNHFTGVIVVLACVSMAASLRHKLGDAATMDSAARVSKQLRTAIAASNCSSQVGEWAKAVMRPALLTRSRAYRIRRIITLLCKHDITQCCILSSIAQLVVSQGIENTEINYELYCWRVIYLKYISSAQHKLFCFKVGIRKQN